jgi:GntR family transcriptional repressor for pyruvate dehydrogenase complex
MGIEASIYESLRVSRKRLHEQIADHLEETIITNHLVRGTQLPAERELAKQFGVTRTTVHQAMTVLEQRGLVEIHAGAGVYVASMPVSIISDSLVRFMEIGQCAPEDIGVVREILEPEEAALAARSRTSEDLERLHQAVAPFDDPAILVDPMAFARVDLAFHEMVAAATHNGVLIAVSVALHHACVQWMDRATQVWPARVYAHSAPLHRPVYEAIAAGDPDRARRAMWTSVHYCVASKGVEQDFGVLSTVAREEVAG